MISCFIIVLKNLALWVIGVAIGGAIVDMYNQSLVHKIAITQLLSVWTLYIILKSAFEFNKIER